MAGNVVGVVVEAIGAQPFEREEVTDVVFFVLVEEGVTMALDAAICSGGRGEGGEWNEDLRPSVQRAGGGGGGGVPADGKASRRRAEAMSLGFVRECVRAPRERVRGRTFVSNISRVLMQCMFRSSEERPPRRVCGRGRLRRCGRAGGPIRPWPAVVVRDPLGWLGWLRWGRPLSGLSVS